MIIPSRSVLCWLTWWLVIFRVATEGIELVRNAEPEKLPWTYHNRKYGSFPPGDTNVGFFYYLQKDSPSSPLVYSPLSKATKSFRDTESLEEVKIKSPVANFEPEKVQESISVTSSGELALNSVKEKGSFLSYKNYTTNNNQEESIHPIKLMTNRLVNTQETRVVSRKFGHFNKLETDKNILKPNLQLEQNNETHILFPDYIDTVPYQSPNDSTMSLNSSLSSSRYYRDFSTKNTPPINELQEDDLLIKGPALQSRENLAENSPESKHLLSKNNFYTNNEMSKYSDVIEIKGFNDSHADDISFFMNSLYVNPGAEVFGESSFVAEEGKQSFAGSSALPFNTSFSTDYQSHLNETSATSSSRIVVRSVDPRVGVGTLPSQSTISSRPHNRKNKKVFEKTSRQSRQSIDGIISGIIKLLGGNVNINRPRPLGSFFPQRPVRRPTVTRINNRGPPDFGTYHQGSVGYHVIPTRPQRPGITDFSLPPLPPPFQTSTAWQFPGVGNLSKLLGLIPSESHAIHEEETDSTVSNLLFGSAETSITIIPNEPVKPTLSDSTTTLKTSVISNDSTVSETSLTFEMDNANMNFSSFLTTNLHNDTKEQVLLNLTDISNTNIELSSSYVITSSLFSPLPSIDETFSAVTTPGLPNIFSSDLEIWPVVSSSSVNINKTLDLSSQITFVKQSQISEEATFQDVSAFPSSTFIPSPLLNTSSDSRINLGNSISFESDNSPRSSLHVQPTSLLPKQITNRTELIVPSVLEHEPSVAVSTSRNEVKVTTTNNLVLPTSAMVDDVGIQSQSLTSVGNPEEQTSFQSSKAESDIPVAISSEEPEIVYGKPSRQVQAPEISRTKILPSEIKIPEDEIFVSPTEMEQMKGSSMMTSNSHYVASSIEPSQQEVNDFPTGQPFVESVDVNDVRPLSGQSPSNFHSGLNRGTPSVAVPFGPHQEGIRPFNPHRAQPNSPFFGTPPERPSFRPRPNSPIIRIDTCIVGDESTCDVTLNERCKTVQGVSACYCRAGHARTVPRGPCTPVVTLQVALLLDRYDGQKLTFTRSYQDPNSKQYQRLEYEAEKGLLSVIQSTKFGSDFKGLEITAFSPYATGEILMNVTVHLNEKEATRTTLVKETLHKELLEAIRKQNQNLGGSHLYVAVSKDPVPIVEDVNECDDSDLHDCSEKSACENEFGSFRCVCQAGFMDKFPNDRWKSGRSCSACTPDFCSNHGTCVVENGKSTCRCRGNYIGEYCDVDGEVLGVAIGASLAAIIIIILTLVCLCLWNRNWKRSQQKPKQRSNGYNNHCGTPRNPLRLPCEDQIRWPRLIGTTTTGSNMTSPEEHQMEFSSGKGHVYSLSSQKEQESTNIYGQIHMPRLLPTRMSSPGGHYCDVEYSRRDEFEPKFPPNNGFMNMQIMRSYYN